MDHHSSHNTPDSNPEANLIALYPMVYELVGDAYFHMLAEHYRAHYAATTPPELFGDRFGQLLLKHYMSHPELDKLAVLPELARLEWLMHDSEGSDDEYVLDTAQLDTVSPEEQPQICFHACPSIRLMYSRWPLFSIWMAHQRGKMDHLSDEGGEEWLCIHQQHEHGQHPVVVEALSEPMAQLLGAILKGYTMGQLSQMNLDLRQYLPLLVRKHWLDYFTLKKT